LVGNKRKTAPEKVTRIIRFLGQVWESGQRKEGGKGIKKKKNREAQEQEGRVEKGRSPKRH